MEIALQPMLLPGERVLWEGQPNGGLIVRPIDAFLIPFSLLWAGFAIFWNTTVWLAAQSPADLPFKLFGLPFLIAALYITFGRFWVDARLRKSLRYAVTDRRIIIYKMGRASTFKSLTIKTLPAIELSERPDGYGTLRFGAATGFFNNQNFGIWQPTFEPTPQFLRIPNVRSVYQLIEKQMDSHDPTQSYLG